MKDYLIILSGAADSFEDQKQRYRELCAAFSDVIDAECGASIVLDVTPKGGEVLRVAGFGALLLEGKKFEFSPSVREWEEGNFIGVHIHLVEGDFLFGLRRS